MKLKAQINPDIYDFKITSNNFFKPLAFGNNLLYQIGRMHCNSKTVIPTHTQLNYIELTVATDGKGTVITNGDKVAINAGDIYVSFPGDFHSILSDHDDPLKFDFLTIQTNDEMLKSDIELIISQCHEADSRTIRNSNIRRFVSNAINEISNPDDLSNRLLQNMIDQIIILIIREFRVTKPNEADKLDNKNLLCLRLMNYIDNHIYTIKNLRELEDISNYTYNYLSNVFKETTGGTLQEYYSERRFEAAQLLLRDGQFSVGHIAEMLGYSSLYSFSLAFKKRYGYPPKEERKCNGKN